MTYVAISKQLQVSSTRCDHCRTCHQTILLVCQLKIFRVVLHPQHNNELNIYIEYIYWIYIWLSSNHSCLINQLEIIFYVIAYVISIYCTCSVTHQAANFTINTWFCSLSRITPYYLSENIVVPTTITLNGVYEGLCNHDDCHKRLTVGEFLSFNQWLFPSDQLFQLPQSLFTLHVSHLCTRHSSWSRGTCNITKQHKHYQSNVTTSNHTSTYVNTHHSTTDCRERERERDACNLNCIN